MASNASNFCVCSTAETAASINAASHLHFIMSGVVASVVSFIGIAGNSLNIVVLARLLQKASSGTGSICSSSSSTYIMLLALAASDLAVMAVFATASLALFARQPPIIQPTDLPPDAGDFRTFVYYTWHIAGNTAACASQWLVVVVTLLRFLAVQFPMRVGVWCTARRARLSVGAVFVLAAALVLPDSATVGFRLDNGGVDGASRRLVGYETPLYADKTYVTVYYTIQTCFIHFVPYVCDFALVLLLVRSLRRRRCRSGSDRGSTGKGANVRLRMSQANRERREHDQRRITAMLIAMVVCSLVLTLPSCAYRMARDFFGVRGRANETSQHFVAFRAVCDVLELCNYALNFYLFCLCNARYRNKFIAVISCRSDDGPRASHEQVGQSLVDQSNGHSGFPVTESSHAAVPSPSLMTNEAIAQRK